MTKEEKLEAVIAGNIASLLCLGIGMGFMWASSQNWKHRYEIEHEQFIAYSRERWDTNNADDSHPKVGDIFVSYWDYRSNHDALDRGFSAEMIYVRKVAAITNGIAYCAILPFSITNNSEYPFPYNEYGPSSNLLDKSRFTLVKPSQ